MDLCLEYWVTFRPLHHNLKLRNLCFSICCVIGRKRGVLVTKEWEETAYWCSNSIGRKFPCEHHVILSNTTSSLQTMPIFTVHIRQDLRLSSPCCYEYICPYINHFCTWAPLGFDFFIKRITRGKVRVAHWLILEYISIPVIVYCFVSRFRIFLSYGDITIASERHPGLCLVLKGRWPRRFSIVLHIVRHWSRFFRIHPKTHPLMTRKGMLRNSEDLI
jgi:hypothetical protein